MYGNAIVFPPVRSHNNFSCLSCRCTFSLQKRARSACATSPAGSTVKVCTTATRAATWTTTSTRTAAKRRASSSARGTSTTGEKRKLGTRLVRAVLAVAPSQGRTQGRGLPPANSPPPKFAVIQLIELFTSIHLQRDPARIRLSCFAQFPFLIELVRFSCPARTPNTQSSTADLTRTSPHTPCHQSTARTVDRTWGNTVRAQSCACALQH